MAGWKDQSLRLWQNLGQKERMLIAGSAVLLFVTLLGWSYWWGARADYVPLFTAMDAKDAGDVAGRLKESKIPFEIGQNGSAILVPAKDVYKIRLDLASQGLPRGSKGFEIFEQNRFGATDFQNRVYLLQALQGELTRTIEQLPEVEKARVHIVLPEDSLYRRNEKPATASIMLKLRGGQLNREQVRGVVNLAAHSVQGLKPENITVIDQSARVLNDQGDAQLATGAGTMTQIEMTRKVQEDLQRGAHSLLEQVLGPGRVAVRVHVELNFDQRTVDRQIFEPVVDDKGLVRSMQELSETFRGTAGGAGGPPGSAANVPGYVTGGTQGSNSNYEKRDITRNFEVNETKEKVVVAPGSVKRLTVAVMVDEKMTRPQQESIAKVVSSAVGLNPARGDAISVESIPFSTEAADRQKREDQAYEQRQSQEYWLKIGAAVVAVLVILYILRILLSRTQREEDIEVVTLAAVPEGSASAATKPKVMTTAEKEKLIQRESLEKLARSNPEDMAQLIKAWLAED